MASPSPQNEYLYSACCCCYNSFTTDLTVLCKSEDECLCCARKCCFSQSEEPMPVGLITDDSRYACKLQLPCCFYALKMPSVCCRGQSKCLCLTSGAAFPFADPNPQAQCACCCLKCVPECGCALPPTGGVYNGLDGKEEAPLETEMVEIELRILKCLSSTVKPIEIGLIKDDKYHCKLGLPCCWLGLKTPTVLCRGKRQCLCFTSGAAFPFADPNPKAQCACCCLKCFPGAGCGMAPTGGKFDGIEGAPDQMEIIR